MTDRNIIVKKPTYVLCSVVRGNFDSFSKDDNTRSNYFTMLTPYNRSSTYLDLLFLLPCNCTDSVEKVTVSGFLRGQHISVSPLTFHVRWNCSSCQEGEHIPSIMFNSGLFIWFPF